MEVRFDGFCIPFTLLLVCSKGLLETSGLDGQDLWVWNLCCFVGESIQRTCPRPQRDGSVWRGHLFSITDRGDMYHGQLMIDNFLSTK